MFATLKSEFRKLVTVRSTYILTALVLVGAMLLSYFIFGREQEAFASTNPLFLRDAMYTMLGVFATFSAIVAILLVTHEYRYNLISYTLTAASRRTKVFAAKAIVLIGYTLVIGAVVAAIGYFGAKTGVASTGAVLAPQDIPVWTTIWQFGAYAVGYTLVGFVLGLLLRSVVGAIVLFFMFPIAEQMMGLLLKENTKYLPFQALERIGATPGSQMAGPATSGDLTSLAALGVFAIYLAIAGIVALILFVRRDAN